MATKKESTELVPSIKVKYTAVPSENVVESFIDELEAMLVERVKKSREDVMMVSWDTGRMIREAEKEHKVSITILVNRLADDNRIAGRQMGERNLWTAVKFFDSFPHFEKVYLTEHGENISFTKVKKMLTSPGPKKEKTMREIAESLVNRLGIEGATELADEIWKVCKALKKKQQDEA